jgi:hypothetical protein
MIFLNFTMQSSVKISNVVPVFGIMKNQKKTITFTIQTKTLKVALGHQGHVTGTGVHLDKRTKRNRTRSAQTKQALNEYK